MKKLFKKDSAQFAISLLAVSCALVTLVNAAEGPDAGSADIVAVPGTSVEYLDNGDVRFVWENGERSVLIHSESAGSASRMVFYTGEKRSGVEVYSQYSKTEAGSNITERFDVIQTQNGRDGEQKFRYVLTISAQMRGAAVIEVSSGDVTTRALIDSETAMVLRRFPEGYEQMFFGPNGPLYGMDQEPLLSYSKAVGETRPAPGGLTAFLRAPGGTGGVASDKCREMSKFGCYTACFTCGVTIFAGPTCTRWIDCIDCKQNGRGPWGVISTHL